MLKRYVHHLQVPLREPRARESLSRVACGGPRGRERAALPREKYSSAAHALSTQPHESSADQCHSLPLRRRKRFDKSPVAMGCRMLRKPEDRQINSRAPSRLIYYRAKIFRASRYYFLHLGTSYSKRQEHNGAAFYFSSYKI